LKKTCDESFNPEYVGVKDEHWPFSSWIDARINSSIGVPLLAKLSRNSAISFE
jgi:hypothetical protein